MTLYLECPVGRGTSFGRKPTTALCGDVGALGLFAWGRGQRKQYAATDLRHRFRTQSGIEIDLTPTGARAYLCVSYYFGINKQ